MLAPLRDELPDGEDGVGAAALAAEAALRLVVEAASARGATCLLVERLHNRFDARMDEVGDDLVRYLQHHDAPIVARVAQVALLW